MDGLLEHFDIRPGADRSAAARLAMLIVSQMAGNQQVETGTPRREIAMMLARAARTGDPQSFRHLLAECRRRRITADRVIDVYLPSAVLLLGEAWHNDELSVLQATIAFARLQDLLRELSRATTADEAGRADGPSVLMVIPQGEQHTISAMLATSQMRRFGVSVAIEFMAAPEQVGERLEAEGFDALFISLANRSAVDACERIIKSLSRSRRSGVPVAVGGPIVAACPDVAPAIGADVVTNSIEQALATCGLLAQRSAAQ